MSRTGLWKGRSAVRALLSRNHDFSVRCFKPCQLSKHRYYQTHQQIQSSVVESNTDLHSHAIPTTSRNPLEIKAGQVTCDDIEYLFCSHNLPQSHLQRRPYKDTTVVQIKECPFCHPIKNERSNMWSAGIFSKSGVFTCLRCGARQKWDQLIHHVQNHGPFNPFSDVTPNPYDYHHHLHHHNQSSLMMNFESGWQSPYNHDSFDDEYSDSIIEHCAESSPIDPTIVQQYTNSLMDSKNRCITNRLIQQRCLSFETLQLYRVGMADHDFCEKRYSTNSTAVVRRKSFMFPQSRIKPYYPSNDCDQPSYSSSNMTEVTRYKVRRVNRKSFCQWPRDGADGLFGLHTLFDDENSTVLSDTLLICEGELDAMSVYEGTKKGGMKGVTAVSTANGANMPAGETLSLIAQHFSKLIIFADWDETGEIFAERFRKELVKQPLEVAVVKKDRFRDLLGKVSDLQMDEFDSCKDANDLVKSGISLDSLRMFENWIE